MTHETPEERRKRQSSSTRIEVWADGEKLLKAKTVKELAKKVHTLYLGSYVLYSNGMALRFEGAYDTLEQARGAMGHELGPAAHWEVRRHGRRVYPTQKAKLGDFS